MKLEFIELRIIENLIEYGINTLKDELKTETHEQKIKVLKDIIKDYKQLKQKFTKQIQNEYNNQTKTN